MLDIYKQLGGFPKRNRLLRRKPIAKLWYYIKGKYRFIRVGPLMTRLFGSQYKRSRNQIEIDITYRCNLSCANCNRSIARAPENLDISIDTIAEFVQVSLQKKIHWRRIRVLGGEPTLHPQFMEIIDLLRSYRDNGFLCSIEVVTNGYGSFVNRKLKELPDDFWIENSRKETGYQPGFRPFSMAPVDDPDYSQACFKNGCEIISVCGMGLTPLGYYPCALAGGIDRIRGQHGGRSNLPDSDDDMEDILEWACRLCGRFKDGHHIPKELVPLLQIELISPSWERLYREWDQRYKEHPHVSE